MIREGAEVSSRWGIIGEEDTSHDNIVRVELGGIWRNQEIAVGNQGSHNALFVDGGSVFATNMVVGFNSSYCNNQVWVDDGQVIVTNATSSAVFEVYRGSLAILGGHVRVDTLIVTTHCAQLMHVGGTLSSKNLVLSPEADTDTDGVPNAWEQANGCNPLDPLDAESDVDGDGMDTLKEYIAGTNPTNAASCLSIHSVLITTNGVRVAWDGMGGKNYVVQTNYGPGTFFSNASPSISIPGNGQVSTNYLDTANVTSSASRLYRVLVVP